MNALDLIALTFCPVGPGFWSASDTSNGCAATNRALGAVHEWHGRDLSWRGIAAEGSPSRGQS